MANAQRDVDKSFEAEPLQKTGKCSQNGVKPINVFGCARNECDKAKNTWSSKLKDRQFRRKFTNTGWLCGCLFSLGLALSLRGPAFLDLQLITNTNVQEASSFLTASAAGLVVGSLLAGPAYDLCSKSLLLIVSVLLMGVLTAVTPFCSAYWAMIVVSFLLACCGGSVGTAGNADVVRIWAGEGQAAMQALHFFFAVGGVLAPVIAEPFLVPSQLTRSHFSNSTHRQGIIEQSFASMTESAAVSAFTGNSTTNSEPLFSFTLPSAQLARSSYLPSTLTTVRSNVSDTVKNTLDTSILPRCNFSGEENAASGDVGQGCSPETRIHFAFLISASLVLLTAVPLLVEYFLELKVKWKARGKKKDNTVKNGDVKIQNQQNRGLGKEKTEASKCRVDELPMSWYLGMLLWMCAFYLLFTAVEATFPSYLTTYAVLQLHWSKAQGAVLTSVFWIALASSRFAAIFLVKVLTVVKLLMACFLLFSFSMVAFLLASLWQQDWGVWLSTAVFGMASSALFPGVLSWADRELLPVTGRVASAVMLSANTGPLLNPLILGHLMQHEAAIWMAWVFLGQAVLCVLTFLPLLLFTRLYLHQKFVSPQSHHDVTIDVTYEHGLPEHSQAFLGETERSAV
ncbi:sodium-dependent glucose transporter 1A-like [Littorina saxatilis]|uniref:Sodium-dependent glucose transporter 1-like n=1 Tax=Littorina saxatilis TaxID=31220 RepID=A0AAN9GHY0_9CAEN